MDYLEPVKKYSGWLIIPFFWLAYYIDYGVSHIKDRALDSVTFIPANTTLAIKTIITMLMVGFILLMVKSILDCISVKINSNIPYGIVAFICLCFGMIAPFKSMEIVPFKNINLFWHLGCLATGFWLFEFVEKISHIGSPQ